MTFARLLLWTAAALWPLSAAAAWPEKPVRMLVPYAAGGGADGAARILAQRLSAVLGQPVLVENRPGAGGAIGAEAVAKAPADGYTVLYDASAFAVNPALRKLPYDPRKDFVAVSLVVVAPNIFVVPPQSPYKNVQEFIAFARSNPARLNFASAGNGSAAHVAGETLNDLAQIDLTHIPYKGGAPALTDLMGGQVAAYFGNAASTLGYVKAGKLRALAVGSAKRLAALPDVPTLIESGLQGFISQEWNGVFVPKGTPDDIVQRLGKEIHQVVTEADTRARYLQLGLEPVGNSPAEFTTFVQTEMTRAAHVVKVRGIKAD